MSSRMRAITILCTLVVLVAGCGKRECPALLGRGEHYEQGAEYHMMGFTVNDESLIDGEPYVVFAIPIELTVFAGDFVVDRVVASGSSEARRVHQAIEDKYGKQLDPTTLNLLEATQYIGTARRYEETSSFPLSDSYEAGLVEGEYYGALQVVVSGNPDLLRRIRGFIVVFGDDCVVVDEIY